MTKRRWLALGVVLGCGAPALAQAPLRSLDRCTAITDPGARLSCYDNALARPAPPAASPAQSARGAVAPNVPAAARKNLNRIVQSAPPRPAPAPSMIDGRITALVPIGDDLFRFRLDDGSVWRTGEQPLMRPQVGETVRIRRSVLAYFATIGGRPAIGVRPAR